MRYATAIWNYVEPDVKLPDLVAEFLEFGYDTISFSSTQFGDPASREIRDTAKLIEARNLGVAIHCSFDFGVAGVARVLDAFGDSVLCITFDAITEFDTRGMFYATGRMAPVIAEVLRINEGTDVRVAIEDLPLDDAALDFCRSDLGPLLEHDRYGMLMDVGHLNMRLKSWSYFEGLTEAEYIERIPVPIVEVHLHDNHGSRDEHAHFGSGNTDFAAVARGLKAVGFDGVSTIEIAPGFHDSAPAESKPHSKASLEQWKTLWEG